MRTDCGAFIVNRAGVCLVMFRSWPRRRHSTLRLLVLLVLVLPGALPAAPASEDFTGDAWWEGETEPDAALRLLKAHGSGLCRPKVPVDADEAVFPGPAPLAEYL